MSEDAGRRAIRGKIELPRENGRENVELLVVMVVVVRRRGALLVRVGGQRVVLDGRRGVGAPQTIAALEIHNQAGQGKIMNEPRIIIAAVNTSVEYDNQIN